MSAINERLREIRKRFKLSLAKFGAPIGYSKSTISQIERGLPPYDGVPDRYLIAVSKNYGISERWIRTGEGEITAAPPASVDPAAARAQLVIGMFRELSPESQALILDLAKALIEEDKAAKKKAADPEKETGGLEEGA